MSGRGVSIRHWPAQLASDRRARCHMGISERGVGGNETGERPYRYVRTCSSWTREVMLSLVKTLLRWYWAVRELM